MPNKSKISLEDLEKKSIFNVPKGYFDNFSVPINGKAIELEKLEKTTIFSVPANYFEELPNKIQQKIAELDKIEVKQWQGNKSVFKTTWSVKRTFAAAASILMVSVGSWFYYSSNQSNAASLKNVSKEEIVSYLSEQDLSELETSDFVKNTNEISTYTSDSLLINQLNINQQDILKNVDEDTEI